MTDTPTLTVLRRWWRPLLLGTVLAALAGFAFASTTAKTYEAQVVLLVGPVNGSTDLDGSGGLARTYADLATSEPVLRSALREAGDRRRADDVRKDVATSSNAITRIVTVAVRDHEPRVAARLANAIGLRLRKLANTAPPAANAALDTFSHQTELAPLSGDERDRVMLAASRIFGASQTGRIIVVQPAAAPRAPASPSIPLMTILAALAGLCLAAFAVFVQEVRERTRLAERVPAGASAIQLSVIEGAQEALEGGLAEIRSGPDSAESYRMLAARTRLLAERGRPVSLLVVDGGDGSAAAAVATNLAAAVADEGREVILADLDPHGANVTEQLGLDNHVGYANVVGHATALSDREDALEHALVRRARHLCVLPAGTAVLPSVKYVAQLTSLVDRLRERADVVVLAGPALTRSSTMMAWARTVDQVCLVVDGEDDGDDVQRLVVGLERLDGGFVGAILRGREDAHPPRVRSRAS